MFQNAPVAKGEAPQKSRRLRARRTPSDESWLTTLLGFASACKAKMVASVILAIISSAGGFLPYVAIYQVIGLYARDRLSFESAFPWLVFAAIAMMANVAFHGISTMLSHFSAYVILEQLRFAVVETLKRAPLGKVYGRSFGTVKTTIVDRIETIERPLAHMIPELTANILIPMAVMAFLILFDWRLAIATFASAIIGAFPMMAAMKDYQQRYDNYMATNAEVNSIIVEYVEGIEVVKAFNQSSSSYEKFVEAIKRFQRETQDWFNSTSKRMGLTMSIMPTTLLGVLPLAIALYCLNALMPLEAAMCVVLSLGILGPLAGIAFFRSEIESASSAVKEARELLRIEPLPDTKTEVSLGSLDIAFENVRFSYEEDGEETIRGISLSVPAGSFCALVGPSGGGKTTLARLLVRFWDIGGGSITMGGVDVRAMSVAQLSNLISFVTQDNFLYNCTLRDNIRAGNPDATDAEVDAAAENAQCGEFVARFEKGLDTPAGEAGKQLSGGERQRIALARAFLKDAPILVLDEATAFTDPESESKIQKAVSRLAQGKTLLVIAHRLSTIKNADQIIVIEQGKVADSGTHGQLLETCDLYQTLWQAHLGAKLWAVSDGSSSEKTAASLTHDQQERAW